MRLLPLFLALLFTLPAMAQPGQVVLPRVEAMPAFPPSYGMRDWKAVARDFHALAFNPDATGTHLPLVRVRTNTVNYPGQPSFALPTYVGDARNPVGEAITMLPAVVGASLVGQNVRAPIDWVRMTQEFFNRRPEENVYLNSPVARSGSDWWYDTMPNVFFYHLYALHGPDVGEARFQFVSVADRWREALIALGGRTTPWARPFLGYRAFALSTMEPLRSGVIEPEAAGAIAWIQYMAWRETGDERYRIAAEWAMEFLNAWDRNPSYELQLPYGVLAAARMNAELGTTYDVERMLNWTFDVGPLRDWGVILGTWGGFDAHGLVGEARYEGYAFALNGYQQAAALVPLVRYDDRFARAIGRWMVNLASASRLFYPAFLPQDRQDVNPWSPQFDPKSVIPYEALRQRNLSISPFATGDAVRGGWAPTNLSVYSGASVGYLAALVDTTEVPGILRLDLNATDFFAGPRYRSFLYYNPHAVAHEVTLRLPFGTYDLYDTTTDAFVLRNQRVEARIPLPPDAARTIVLVPAGAATVVESGQLKVGNLVVDYRYGAPPAPRPRLRAVDAPSRRLGRDEQTRVFCSATHPANATLTYAWSTTGGVLTPDGAQATFQAPSAGTYIITCTAQDPAQNVATGTIELQVVTNRAPRITSASRTQEAVLPGREVGLACAATDPDGDALSFAWTVQAGQLSGTGATPAWTLPDAAGYYRAVCTARDPGGLHDSLAVFVTVGDLILDLPLGETLSDRSPFAHSLGVNGTRLAENVFGQPDAARLFDGEADALSLTSTPPLSPRSAISVMVWAKPLEFERERFLVSHGSWQNRWKLSLTPDGVPRWTVRTATGVVDLDAPSPLSRERFTHLAATYDGAFLRLYVDGVQAAERAFTGLMPETDLPLLIGQMLPGDAAYNFAGVMHDVRLYNRALSREEIQAQMRPTSSESASVLAGPTVRLWPHPARDAVQIELAGWGSGEARVRILDALGRVVFTQDVEVGPHAVALRLPALHGAAGWYLMHVEQAGTRLAHPFLWFP